MENISASIDKNTARRLFDNRLKYGKFNTQLFYLAYEDVLAKNGLRSLFNSDSKLLKSSASWHDGIGAFKAAHQYEKGTVEKKVGRLLNQLWVLSFKAPNFCNSYELEWLKTITTETALCQEDAAILYKLDKAVPATNNIYNADGSDISRLVAEATRICITSSYMFIPISTPAYNTLVAALIKLISTKYDIYSKDFADRLEINLNGISFEDVFYKSCGDVVQRKSGGKISGSFEKGSDFVYNNTSIELKSYQTVAGLENFITGKIDNRSHDSQYVLYLCRAENRYYILKRIASYKYIDVTYTPQARPEITGLVKLLPPPSTVPAFGAVFEEAGVKIYRAN